MSNGSRRARRPQPPGQRREGKPRAPSAPAAGIKSTLAWRFPRDVQADTPTEKAGSGIRFCAAAGCDKPTAARAAPRVSADSGIAQDHAAVGLLWPRTPNHQRDGKNYAVTKSCLLSVIPQPGIRQELMHSNHSTCAVPQAHWLLRSCSGGAPALANMFTLWR